MPNIAQIAAVPELRNPRWVARLRAYEQAAAYEIMIWLYERLQDYPPIELQADLRPDFATIVEETADALARQRGL